MNIRELAQSRYLKKEDFHKPCLVTIEQDVWIETIPGYDGEADREKAVIKFMEFDKPMTLNTTNANIIAQALGSEETQNWIGKQIVVFNDPNVMMKGKMTGGIRVRASRMPQQVQQAAPATVLGRPVVGAQPARVQPRPGELAPDPMDDTPF